MTVTADHDAADARAEWARRCVDATRTAVEFLALYGRADLILAQPHTCVAGVDGCRHCRVEGLAREAKALQRGRHLQPWTPLLGDPTFVPRVAFRRDLT